MKTDHINLLTAKTDYRRKYQFFSYFRITTMFIGVITLIALASVSLFKKQKQYELTSYTTKTQTLLARSDVSQDSRQQQDYLLSRLQDARLVLSDSIDYKSLYKLLFAALPQGDETVRIKDIKIDAERKVNINLEFATETSLLSFLNIVESEQFQDQFTDLVIQNLKTNSVKGGPIKMSINGSFVAL
ncbi:MAG: hypothetical protein ACE5DQ_00330 [Candidatus Paceibacterota bacterium]